MQISDSANKEIDRLLAGRPAGAGVRFYVKGHGWAGPQIGQAVVDGPSPGDVVAAPRIFLDSHLAGLVSGGGRLDWNAFREKLWIVHRALARG